MPSGFQQRFKGKVSAGALWLGGAPQFGAGSVIPLTTNAALNIPNVGTATLVSSSAATVWQMLGAPQQGLEMEIVTLNVANSVFIKAAPGTSFDPSTNTVIKSTQAQNIAMIGLSTVKWSIKSVFPASSAGGAPLGGITLSTTT